MFRKKKKQVTASKLTAVVKLDAEDLSKIGEMIMTENIETEEGLGQLRNENGALRKQVEELKEMCKAYQYHLEFAIEQSATHFNRLLIKKEAD